jgi:uncharacterized protein (DUF486 family)
MMWCIAEWSLVMIFSVFDTAMLQDPLTRDDMVYCWVKSCNDIFCFWHSYATGPSNCGWYGVLLSDSLVMIFSVFDTAMLQDPLTVDDMVYCWVKSCNDIFCFWHSYATGPSNCGWCGVLLSDSLVMIFSVFDTAMLQDPLTVDDMVYCWVTVL